MSRGASATQMARIGTCELRLWYETSKLAFGLKATPSLFGLDTHEVVCTHKLNSLLMVFIRFQESPKPGRVIYVWLGNRLRYRDHDRCFISRLVLSWAIHSRNGMSIVSRLMLPIGPVVASVNSLLLMLRRRVVRPWSSTISLKDARQVQRTFVPEIIQLISNTSLIIVKSCIYFRLCSKINIKSCKLHITYLCSAPSLRINCSIFSVVQYVFVVMI